MLRQVVSDGGGQIDHHLTRTAWMRTFLSRGDAVQPTYHLMFRVPKFRGFHSSRLQTYPRSEASELHVDRQELPCIVDPENHVLDLCF
jgi:hypothetical protein